LRFWLENVYLRPFLVYLGLWTPKRKLYRQKPQKAYLSVERRRMTYRYRSSKSVHRFDLWTWRIDHAKSKKDKETSQWQTWPIRIPVNKDYQQLVLYLQAVMSMTL